MQTAHLVGAQIVLLCQSVTTRFIIIRDSLLIGTLGSRDGCSVKQDPRKKPVSLDFYLFPLSLSHCPRTDAPPTVYEQARGTESLFVIKLSLIFLAGFNYKPVGMALRARQRSR